MRKDLGAILTVTFVSLDCKKAFDKCLFTSFLSKILDRGVPIVIVRGLLHIYPSNMLGLMVSISDVLPRVWSE